MLLGRVTGTVVASQKEPLMEGLTFLLVRQVDADNADSGGSVVAVDAVGAGVGEVVMYASGSSARQTRSPRTVPVMPSSWPSSTPGKSTARRST